VIDKIKKNDLKQIFEILMILPANRTIADLNTLTKIVLNVIVSSNKDRTNQINKKPFGNLSLLQVNVLGKI
jgi:hypothetical protein